MIPKTPTERPLPENGIAIYTATVQPDWLDYNQHMNVAYYTQTFDLASDDFKGVVGFTREYIDQEKRSTVALECHITYQQEAHLGDELRVESRVIDFDGKRAHLYQEMYRGEELLATQETMAISFDTAARRSCPFDERFTGRYEAMLEAQRALSLPEGIGRSVGIRRKK